MPDPTTVVLVDLPDERGGAWADFVEAIGGVNNEGAACAICAKESSKHGAQTRIADANHLV